MNAVAGLDRATVRLGGRVILRDADLVARRGEIIVISGTSGTGKTTLLNLLAGYVEPTHGSVRVSRDTAYLMQTDTLFSAMTVGQHLALCRAARRIPDPAEGDDLSLLASLHLTTSLDTRIEGLSGGERQRLRIAGLLQAPAELILLDEPTASLDAETAKVVGTALRAASTASALVVVAHHHRDQSWLDDAHAFRIYHELLIHE